MLSLKTSKDSKQFAVIQDAKTGKVLESLSIIERKSYLMEEDENLQKALEKYCSHIGVATTFVNPPDAKGEPLEETLTRKILLKEKYKLQPAPPMFSKDGSNQRITSTIIGKSGSGKSFYTAKYVSAYHHMYPNNLIYYVSANSIESDPSYANLLKKTSFKKVLIAIDLRTINCQIDSEKYGTCLFIFDDIMDVQISMEPEKLRKEYLAEKEKTYYVKEKKRVKAVEERKRLTCEEKGKDYTAPEEEVLLSRMRKMEPEDLIIGIKDTSALDRLLKWKSQQIKGYIQDSIHDILKRGRKYSISCITTTHRFFDRDDTTQATIDESMSVVLFPYANVSREKLVEFLRVKLCFDLKQARAVADRVYKQYEYLYINTDGAKFFLTSNYLEFL